MNIFHLDNCPIKAAKMHHDKHVVKMILETAQMLSSAHRFLDGELYIDRTANTGRKVKRWQLPDSREDILYKATHINHPSTVWTRNSAANYHWLYVHFVALCEEYTHRYGKIHATETKLREALFDAPKNIENIGLTEFAQAMPDQYKDADPVKGYHKYYIAEKKSQSKYTNREAPVWL